MALLLEVLPCLVDYLTVGELYRLRRTLGHKVEEYDGLCAPVVARRMGLTTRLGKYTLEELGHRMASTQRCVECGTKCTRTVKVCDDCGQCTLGFRALCTRKDLKKRNGANRPWRMAENKLLDRIRAELKVVKRDRNGQFYYWARDADALFARVPQGSGRFGRATARGGSGDATAAHT